MDSRRHHRRGDEHIRARRPVLQAEIGGVTGRHAELIILDYKLFRYFIAYNIGRIII